MGHKEFTAEDAEDRRGNKERRTFCFFSAVLRVLCGELIPTGQLPRCVEKNRVVFGVLESI